jgi:PilZ domain
MAEQFNERRRYPRYPCDTGVRIHPEKGNAGYWGTLSDISFGGCYVYTFSPLQAGQMITVVIKANDSEINVAGRVASSHPGVGMGIAFQGFIQEDGEERLRAYIDYLSKQPRSNESAAVFH